VERSAMVFNKQKELIIPCVVVDARTVWTIEILFWILTAEIVETGVNAKT
jgi:hypothetical protein